MNVPDAIEWLLTLPKKNADRIFLMDDIKGEEITYQALHESACVIGSNLYELGLKKGDRISVLLNNSSELAKLYFGILYTGLVVVPINPILTKQEVEYIILHSHSKLVMVSHETLEMVDQNMLAKKGIDILLILDDLQKSDESKIKSWHLKNMKKDAGFKPLHDVTANDEMIVVYTSGTTAEPKAVVHRIHDLIDNARLFGKTLGISSVNRFINILSLTYLGGYYNLLMLPYVCESSVVLTKTFDAKTALDFWKPIIKQKVNTIWLVPSIMSIILEMDRGKEGIEYCSKNNILILVGTAPLPVQIRTAFERRYNVKVYENYGLSETLFISTNSPNFPSHEGSVGQLLSGVKLRIVNEHGAELPFNSEGEIVVQTPYLMKEYYEPNKGVEELDSNKIWFQTGDLGLISNNNSLFITGRKKDLIIRGGINLSPVSIENVIYKHPSVLECAVVGMPHKFQGEEIVAVVHLDNHSNFEKIKEEIMGLCKDNLSPIKQPSKIIQLSVFPHATYGKIQKNKIKALLLKQTLEPSQEKRIDQNREILIERKYDFSPSAIVTNSIEALSIKYNTMVYEMQRRGEDIVVLSLGEAFFEIPLFPFDSLPYPKIYHYSHSRGIPELRKKISKYFFETYDVAFNYEKEILITAGSKIGIHMCIMSIINPGDEVIIHEPAWVSFPEQIKLCYGIPVQVPYYKSVYDFEDYITSKTKMIIINNPNNPTGKVYTLEELSHLYKLVNKYKLFVLSDEAYSDFVLNRDDFVSFANLDTEKKHSIVVNSLSKNLGMSGWRLGYVITNADLINQLLKLNQHLVTCPPTILEYYVAKYFDDIIKITKPQIVELVKKRQEIKDFLDSISLKYILGHTTFYFFVSISESKLSSDEFCSQLLQNYHVSAVPGIGYGKSCDKFIRISVGAENIDRIKKGLQSIKTLISKTSG